VIIKIINNIGSNWNQHITIPYTFFICKIEVYNLLWSINVVLIRILTPNFVFMNSRKYTMRTIITMLDHKKSLKILIIERFQNILDRLYVFFRYFGGRVEIFNFSLLKYNRFRFSIKWEILFNWFNYYLCIILEIWYWTSLKNNKIIWFTVYLRIKNCKLIIFKPALGDPFIIVFHINNLILDIFFSVISTIDKCFEI